jgi:iron complex transport system substrate-binding protein
VSGRGLHDARGRVGWTFARMIPAAVLAVMLVSCSRPHSPAKHAAARPAGSGYPVVVTDDLGRRVTIPSEPRRIVSLAPSNTELLFALGLGDRVVGVTRYCNYPPEVRRKPRVGDMNTSVEKVLALDPDLILAHGFLNDSVVRQFQGLGKCVISLDPKTISQVESDIALVGRACGRMDRAGSMVREMRSAQGAVSRSSTGRTGLRTLVVVQPSPLWVAGPKTFVDEMLSICGAGNVARDARPGFNTFPVEKALARDPELIIVGRESERGFFSSSPVWRGTSAVRGGRVVVVDPDILVRPGPRLVQGLRTLSRVTHPGN